MTLIDQCFDAGDRFGLAAGLRRYDDLRTSAYDVGQVVLHEDGPTVEHG